MSVTLTKTEDQIAGVALALFPERAAGAHPHVRVYSGLKELPESFLNLFEQAERESFFLTLPWFQNFIQTAMAPADRVRIYAAASAQEAPAGMLLMPSVSYSNSFSSPRKLEGLDRKSTRLNSRHP